MHPSFAYHTSDRLWRRYPKNSHAIIYTLVMLPTKHPKGGHPTQSTDKCRHSDN